MKTPNTPIKLVALASFSSLFLGAAAFGQTTIFGSDFDGDGGFTTSALAGTEAWTVAAQSYNYAFGVVDVDESHTASLLKSFTLDKSAGNAYTIEGVLDLTAGYGDDNNRIGILLFNTTATQTADGGGGLYLRVNTDDGSTVGIQDGINGSPLNVDTVNHSYNPGDQWIGQTLTFTADLTFRNDGIDDVFDVSFNLLDGNSNNYTVGATDLVTADYAGEYFGFASKRQQQLGKKRTS